MAKLRGLSLFANVGIAEAYMKNIGVDIVLANEIDIDRARFYQDVYPETHMICGDITDDEVRANIVNEAIEKNVNFVIATPPCQGMSEAGLRLEFDPRNQLVSYAVDIIKRIKPDIGKCTKAIDHKDSMWRRNRPYSRIYKTRTWE